MLHPALLLLAATWLGESFFYRHDFEAFTNRLLVQAEALCPGRQTERFAAEREDVVVALVPTLLFPRSPPTVGGLVVTVVVQAFYTATFRWRTHIGQEGLEAVAPARAYGNAAASISDVCGHIAVTASVEHSLPDAVDGRVRCVVRPIVAGCAQARAVQASAGICAGATHVVAAFSAVRAAGTYAVPIVMPSLAHVAVGDHDQVAKAFAYEIFHEVNCSV